MSTNRSRSFGITANISCAYDGGRLRDAHADTYLRVRTALDAARPAVVNAQRPPGPVQP
jgi:hypothetical protein